MIYDEDYFTKAKHSPYIGYPKSNLGVDVVSQMKERANYLAEEEEGNSHFIDWGCATGILVNELNKKGFVGIGYDFAGWAIENRVCDNVFKVDALTISASEIPPVNFMHSSDFLEHLPSDKILDFLVKISTKCDAMYHYVPFYPDFVSPVDDGTGVHLTEVNSVWWKNVFLRIPNFEIVDFTINPLGGYVVCKRVRK